LVPTCHYTVSQPRRHEHLTLFPYKPQTALYLYSHILAFSQLFTKCPNQNAVYEGLVLRPSVLRLFTFDALYLVTTLINLRSIVFGLTLFGWLSFIYLRLEICALLGYYAASCRNCLSTFRDNVSASSSRRIISQKSVGLISTAVEAWNQGYLHLVFVWECRFLSFFIYTHFFRNPTRA
jgi:hypothetical protein